MDRIAEHHSRLEELKRSYELSSVQTAPCDRLRAEASVVNLYAQHGLPPPQFTWFDSPMQALKAMILWDLVTAVGEIRKVSPQGNPLFFTESTILKSVSLAEGANVAWKFRSQWVN